MDLNFCGIYVILNSITGQRYIGSSSNIGKRFKEHKYLLLANKHPNYKMQKSFNNSRFGTFKYQVICKCSENLKIYLEQQYITYSDPEFNIVTSNIAGSPMQGRKHSQKTLDKMKGRETWNKGIPRTKEEKALMSIRRKEASDRQSKEDKEKHRKRSSEFLKRVKPFKGKSHTEERRAQIRKGHVNRYAPIICNETKKIYEAQLDIAKDLKIKQGHISEHLNGKRSHIKGYTFKYLHPPKRPNKRLMVLEKKHKGKAMRDCQGNYFKSIHEACSFHKLTAPCVYNRVKKGLSGNYSVNFEYCEKQISN